MKSAAHLAGSGHGVKSDAMNACNAHGVLVPITVPYRMPVQ
jgi:hypothetical protein